MPKESIGSQVRILVNYTACVWLTGALSSVLTAPAAVMVTVAAFGDVTLICFMTAALVKVTAGEVGSLKAEGSARDLALEAVTTC